jgi:hypothetical protein
MEAEPANYRLEIYPGSGWNGANWLVGLYIPAYGIWPARYLTLRHFEAEKEARAEAAKMVVDIVQSSSERR